MIMIVELNLPYFKNLGVLWLFLSNVIFGNVMSFDGDTFPIKYDHNRIFFLWEILSSLTPNQHGIVFADVSGIPLYPGMHSGFNITHDKRNITRSFLFNKISHLSLTPSLIQNYLWQAFTLLINYIKNNWFFMDAIKYIYKSGTGTCNSGLPTK